MNPVNPETRRLCPFNNYPELPCPAEDVEYFAMRETCDPGEFGKKCGPVVMQKILLDTLDERDLSSTFDKGYGLITGYARVNQTPQGDMPERIRASIAGLEFPLRALRPSGTDEISVTHADLILTLMRRQLVEAANFYNKYRFNAAVAGAEVEWWNFDQDEVTVRECSEPVSSIHHYDDSFNLRSPVVYNGHLTYLSLIRIANVDHRPTLSEKFSSPKVSSGSKNIEDVQLPE